DYGGRYPTQQPQQSGGMQQRGNYGSGRPGVSTRPPRRRESEVGGPADSSGRSPTGGATIGERLGALRGFLKPEAGETAPEEKPEE
ncbi:MAG: hypothetical protein ABUL72_07350, partial [Armatimonadota bacterium]